MINYSDIKEKYPKAFEALLEKGNAGLSKWEPKLAIDEDGWFGWDGEEYGDPYQDRNLYDFFDEQGVFIETSVELTG